MAMRSASRPASLFSAGSARTQEAADKAASIARETEHVKSVHSDIKIQKDD
jgi:osmotically-inducible protein OsmY